MGWWKATPRGGIDYRAKERAGTGAVWGDPPADALDIALDKLCQQGGIPPKSQIIAMLTGKAKATGPLRMARGKINAAFRQELGRAPTPEDIKRGVIFAYAGAKKECGAKSKR